MRQLTCSTRACRLAPYVTMRVYVHATQHAVVCCCSCSSLCVSGVCGDSCSLNSIIVSNWGLPSQCVALKCVLSERQTGYRCTGENLGAGVESGVVKLSLTLVIRG